MKCNRAKSKNVKYFSYSVHTDMAYNSDISERNDRTNVSFGLN